MKNNFLNSWSSQRLFIFAAVGSAVGLGNLWKFPYIVGENGGGAFVIVYLLCIGLIGLPLLIAEISLGKAGKLNPPQTMQKLTKEVGGSKYWSIIGYNGLIAALIILSFYTVIAGWGMAYFVDSLTGVLTDIDKKGTKQDFDNLIANPVNLIIWHSIVSVITITIIAKGVKLGIEKSVNFMLPALFIILIILLIWTILFSGGFIKSINFLFNLDFSKFSWNSVIVALGHAFFTLSLGFGTMMVYGSYMPKQYSIVRVSLWIVFTDTIIALIAGLVIFSIVFGNDLALDSGPGLLFITLPIAFGQIFAGQLFAILFFALVVVATISSSISLLEPSVSFITQKYHWSRIKATLTIGIFVWLFGFISIFSFNIWQDFKPLADKNLFNILDFTATNILLPLSGLLIALFTGWVWSEQKRKIYMNIGDRLTKFLTFSLKFIVPIALIIIFILNL